MKSDLLVFSDLRWLRRITLGIDLAAAAYLIASLMMILELVFQFTLFKFVSQFTLLEFYSSAVRICGEVALHLLALSGLWLFASPAPTIVEDAAGNDLRSPASRRVLRFACLIVVPTTALSLYERHVTLASTSTAPGSIFVFTLIHLISILSLVLCSLAYPRNIAFRASAPVLAEFSSFLLWGIGLSLAVTLPLALISSGPTGFKSFAEAANLGSCVICLGFAMYAMMLPVLAIALHQDCRRNRLLHDSDKRLD